MKRSTTIVAALVGLVAFVPAAYADSSSADTSTSGTTTTQTPTTETPPATETPVTVTPATTTVTETPATTTEVPATTDVPTTTVTDTPVTTGGVDTTVPIVDTCVTDCIPEDTAVCAECVPGVAGTGVGGIPTAVAGAGTLPFTGIEDMVAPILLALTVVLGGVVAWRWAQLRESVAIDAGRARPLPAKEARSGYADAIRRQVIDQRARAVFTPRVA